MATNGKSVINGPNGNGKSTAMKTVAEIGGFGAAEVVSEGVWIGSAILTGFIPKHLMDVASSALGKCIEPVLKPVEATIGGLCKLEECKPNPDIPREKRAQELARILITYVPGILLSLQAKVQSRRYFGSKMGIEIAPPGSRFWQWSLPERLVMVADEIPTLGALWMFNRPLAPVTDDLIKSTSGILHKTMGMGEKKAHEMATALCMWGLPNSIGMVGASLAIAGKNAYHWPESNALMRKVLEIEKYPVIGGLFKGKSHAEKLAQSTSLSGHAPVL